MSEVQALPRVGCGVAILDEERLLLVRRKRMPEAGHWGLPGGKVDPFETVSAAAEREILEELGIHIEADHLLGIVDQIDRERNEHWVAPVYLVRSYEGVPTIMEPDALAELGWFRLDDLPAPLTQSTLHAIRCLKAPPGGHPSNSANSRVEPAGT